jgi:DNA-binding LacI/PurR family transcriptional regulator
MVTLTFDKPVIIERLAHELISAGHKRLSYVNPGNNIVVLDSQDIDGVMDVYNAHNLTAEELIEYNAQITAAVTVKFVMATKNASSSAYYGQFHRLQLRRTA